MPDDKKPTFPYIPKNVWATLRKRFAQSMPKTVTPGYLASVAGVREPTAKNWVGPLRACGLIDDEGRPTDRAVEWRTDDGYSKVCDAIVEQVYPQELRDACPPPDVDTGAASAWFGRATGGGEAARNRLASFYSMLTSGVAPTTDNGGKTTKKAAAALKTQKNKASTSKQSHSDPPGGGGDEKGKEKPPRGEANRFSPTVHIDLQIHISPDATPEQIEQIFSSMAKHLYASDQ